MFCPRKQEASTLFHLPPPVLTNTVIFILSQLVDDKSHMMNGVCFQLSSRHGDECVRLCSRLNPFNTLSHLLLLLHK